MFDWMGSDFSLRENLTHFFLCNNRLLPGCVGHFAKPQILAREVRVVTLDLLLSWAEEHQFAGRVNIWQLREKVEHLKRAG